MTRSRIECDVAIAGAAVLPARLPRRQWRASAGADVVLVEGSRYAECHAQGRCFRLPPVRCSCASGCGRRWRRSAQRRPDGHSKRLGRTRLAARSFDLPCARARLAPRPRAIRRDARLARCRYRRPFARRRASESVRSNTGRFIRIETAKPPCARLDSLRACSHRRNGASRHAG